MYSRFAQCTIFLFLDINNKSLTFLSIHLFLLLFTFLSLSLSRLFILSSSIESQYDFSFKGCKSTAINESAQFNVWLRKVRSRINDIIIHIFD